MEQVPAHINKKKKGKQRPVSGRIARDVFEIETRLYFESIRTPPKLFVEVQKVAKPFVYLDLKNLVVLLIFETFGLDKWVDLCIVSKCQSHPETSSQTGKSCLLRLKSSVVFLETTKFFNSESKSSILREDQNFDVLYNSSRKHPSITVAEKNLIICGLSSAVRFMFKYICYMIGESNSDNTCGAQVDLRKCQQFLGFRGGCLQACAESSVWTKFCEIDMISAVTEITSNFESGCNALDLDTSRSLNSTNKVNLELKVPESLVRFENHLSLPVKIHNFRKVVQDFRKNENPVELSQTDELCKGVENILITDIKHEYAEGTTLLLSDLILYPSVHACLLVLGREVFNKLLPISSKWYDRVLENLPIQADIDLSCSLPANYTDLHIVWTNPEVPIQSLYSKDLNRYKPTLRQFTRQDEIVEALQRLHSQQIKPLEVSEENPEFNWSNIPLLAHPEGGNLPKCRITRKCSQLANMAHYALKVVHSKKQQRNNGSSKPFRVVDFCSGGGHLGILMAWLMREEDDGPCEFVLIENKEESLRRAQIRVQGLGLSNFIFYQSNVDYFEGEFDLGMALHACGTATDLVLSKCIGANASFVCCPCCYGAIQENHVLNYPRSSNFMKVELPLRHYFVLCHASDQTHDEANEKTNQGKLCMTIIDTDRCLHAQDNSYDVKLCKIVPETASPKNHILVGISSDK